MKDDWKFLLGAVMSALYPRRCPFCGEVIGFATDCPSCRKISRAWELQDASLDRKTHYFGRLQGAAAVYRYTGGVRDAILQMKYQLHQWYAWDLGCGLAKGLLDCTFHRKYGIILPELVPGAADYWDVIVPVPASSPKRGYNVPYLLARPLAYATGLPIQPKALQRVRCDKHQAGLSLGERLANVVDAFAPAGGCDVAGKRVLLVDDVITTGATAAACAEALLAAGAKSVYAVALASSQPQVEQQILNAGNAERIENYGTV